MCETWVVLTFMKALCLCKEIMMLPKVNITV